MNRLLPSARGAEGVAHHRVVGKAPDAQPNGGMGVEQAGRPAQIEWVGHPDVVIEKDDPLPAELVAEHQGQVALGTQIGPPLEHRPGQQARGLQLGKPELGRVRNIDRDQVNLRVEVGGGCESACPFPAVQCDERAAQGQRGCGRFLQVGHRASGGHEDRVNLRQRR